MSIYFEYTPYDQRIQRIFVLESQTFFSQMVDELVEFSEYDPELASGIKWLDYQARKRGITLYDMVFEVLYKHNIDSKARDWFTTRN